MSKRERGVGLVLAITTLAGALAPAGSEPQDPNKAIAQEQLKLAQQALRDLDLMHKGGGLGRTDPRFDLWQRRQVEAVRATGAGKAELVTALETFLNWRKTQERLAQLAVQKDQGSR